MAKTDKLDKSQSPMKTRVSDDEKRWRAESALSDLERAEKHRSDPELMRDVDDMRREKMANLSKINVKVESAPKTIGRKK